ncbi:MAG TPA: exosortase/archaeosortase family protein [Phycisphaerae bacterium]|nr:exosortase/archaeosortase family protein [Phycisphaerae bacterium]
MAELPTHASLADNGMSPRGRGWWTTAMTVQAAVLAVVLGLHYRHVIRYLVDVWSNNGDWSHGFIIPLFGLYYLYLQRHRMPLGLKDRDWLGRAVGAALLLAAFSLYMHYTLAKTTYPKTVAMVVSILGAVLMTCGWTWTRWGWFAIAFLVFALPLPQRLYFQITLPLREIAANVSAAVLALLPEMEAEARGAVVEYFYQGKSQTLDIEQACSGMRLLMTMSALGVAMAFVSERPLWHRLVMILACVPIAIFCNMIRVTTTGMMVVFGRNDLAKGFWHTMLGLGMLLIAFSLYGGISYVLNHLFVEHNPEEQAGTCGAAAGGAQE